MCEFRDNKWQTDTSTIWQTQKTNDLSVVLQSHLLHIHLFIHFKVSHALSEPIDERKLKWNRWRYLQGPVTPVLISSMLQSRLGFIFQDLEENINSSSHENRDAHLYHQKNQSWISRYTYSSYMMKTFGLLLHITVNFLCIFSCPSYQQKVSIRKNINLTKQRRS